MSSFNQKSLSFLLISMILALYLGIGSFILQAKVSYDCMKYKLPHAQVIGLNVYCGGMWKGDEIYVTLSYLKDKYGESYGE